jgi:hypothetical protein
VNLFLLRARHAAWDGNFPSALKDFEEAFRFTRNTSEGNATIIESMISLGLKSSVLGTLLNSCLWSEKHPPTDEKLKQAQELIRRYRPTLSSIARPAFLGEKDYMWKGFIKMSSDAGQDWPGAADPVRILNLQPVFQTLRMEIALQNLEFTSKCAGLPLDWKARYSEWTSKQFTGFLTYNYGVSPRVCLTFAACDAEFKIADAALAAKRHQLKHGAWPKTLDECVPEFLPEVPADTWQPGGKLQIAFSPARIFTANLKGRYYWDTHTDLAVNTDVLMSDIAWHESQGSAYVLERGEAELKSMEYNAGVLKKAEEEAAEAAAQANPQKP